MATKTASASLEERLKANPDSLSFSRVAEYFRTSGDIARAIDICVSGNTKHPDYVTGRIVLGRCYADLDNFDEAVKVFTSVCELDRRNMVAMKMLADIFLRLGSRQKAGDLYALLTAMDPWNESLSRLAAQTPGSRNVEVAAILREQPVGPKDMFPGATPGTRLPQDIFQAPLQEALRAMPPEVAMGVDLDTRKVVPGRKSEAEPEAAENAPDGADGAIFEATTVTGKDIADRMAMLFGEKQAVEEPAVPLEEKEAAAEIDDDGAIDGQPVGTIPDGNTVSSRIDELFNRDTLKIPAIKEVAPGVEPSDDLFRDKTELDHALDDIMASRGGPSAVDEVEFEETIIMDTLEVKEFLRRDLEKAEGLQKQETAGDESVFTKEEPGLIADAARPSVETAAPAELIADENDARDAENQTGPLTALPAADDRVVGDDVVRRMTDFFEGEEDKAISEVVGPETIDDFFESSDLVVGPLPTEKAKNEPVAASEDEKPSLFPEEEPGDATPLPVPEATITGDDVADRIDGFFGRRAQKSGEAPVANDPSMTTAETPPAIDFPTVPETGAMRSFLAQKDEGIMERAAGESERPPETEERDKATPATDDMITGDDVAGRIAGMFSGPKEDREAAMALSFLTDEGGGGIPGIDEMRVVEAGRRFETDDAKNTATEMGEGIISGADIEERIEEYFRNAADKTAPQKKEAPAASPPPVEEDAGPDLHKDSGTTIDKMVDYEETIVAYSSAFIDLTDMDDAGPGNGSPVDDEESIVEPAGSPDETLDVKEPGALEETPAPETVEVSVVTSLFTDFTAGSVADAPPPPPEVPLFTIANPCTLDKDSVDAEIPDASAGPAAPEIPDHVLTPTLADIYLQQGQPKLALTIYRRLLEKKPDNEKLEARIKEIEKSLAEGILPTASVEQKPAVAVPIRKKPAPKSGAHARQQTGGDTRPLAGVRLKKRPKSKLKKKH